MYILFVKHRNFEFSLRAQGFSLVSDEKVRGLLSSLLLLFIKLYALNPAFDPRLDFDQVRWVYFGQLFLCSPGLHISVVVELEVISVGAATCC